MKNTSEIIQSEQFKNLEFIAQQIVEGFITGLHKSPYHGFSVEFAEHRLYNAGESTKHIDWKLFARTDKLFVKKYEEETNLRCQIVIDVSSSMLYPHNEKGKISKLAFSVYCAAALINLLRKQRDAVGITLFSNNIDLHTEAKLSVSHAKRLYAELDKLLVSSDKPEQKLTEASKSLHLIAESIHKRSLVVIFSDMFENESTDEIFSAIQHLKYNKHEVILFHVSDKNKEEEFVFENRPYKFIDLETNEEIKLNPNDIRTVYKERYKDFVSDIKNKAIQHKIDYVEADINRDFNAVLLPYLIKRGKLY
ncbi:MAG: hypothetical protein A2W98_03070 [Bacteroidetes bacterium GWF2_33_38]|nr:MAG: hypothetical protein A2W98_03070 [Bacteroidetes bacterium GWF2_33_38]